MKQKNIQLKNNRIYLDHSATTPVAKEVLNEMTPYFSKYFANPSAIYKEGQFTRNIIFKHRSIIANLLNISYKDVIFTSGASESNSLAIIGLAMKNRNTNKKKLILGPTEHSSVKGAAEYLSKYFGFQIKVLPSDQYGLINVNQAKKLISTDVAIVAVGFACSEIGTCQPIELISELCKNKNIPLHVDASQIPGYFDLEPKKNNWSSMTLSSHKIYGPKGIGLLYLNSAYDINPQILGGGQEFGKRSGTENIASIVGFSKALQMTFDKTTYSKIIKLTLKLREQLKRNFSQIQFTGHPINRLPFHISFVNNVIDSQTMLMKLDLEGIAASIGSSCNIGKNKPLDILLKLGYNHTLSSSAIRLSLGKLNKDNNIEKIIEILSNILK